MVSAMTGKKYLNLVKIIGANLATQGGLLRESFE